MADLGGGATGGPEAEPPAPMESDFSVRKIKIATVSLIGMTFATSILPYGALGFVLLPMTKELGWTRLQFSASTSFLMIFGALTVWALGRMTDKIGVRPIIIWGTLAVGLITLAMPHIGHLWQFYTLCALLGIFGSSGASYSKVVASLFTQNRGKAMAVFGAESTVARAFIPTVTALLIATYTWRGMFTAFGLVILLILPLLYFGLEEPGTYGRLPKLFGRRKDAARGPLPPRIVFDGMTLGQVIRDKVLWLMLAGGLPIMIVNNGVFTNLVAAVQDKGFTTQTAGWVLTMSTFIGLAGTLLGGWMMDRFNSAKIAIPFSVTMALSYLLLLFVTPKLGGQSALLAAVGLWMFSFAAQFPMAGYFMTRFWGLKSFAEITGFLSMIQALSMGVLAPLVGYVHDATGSYDTAFKIGIAACLLSSAVYFILPMYRYSANIGALPAPPKAGGAAPPPMAHPAPAE